MLLQLPTLTLWCSSIKYVFKWPKIPVLIRTTKFSEENRNMTRQKKCLLLRVCLVKSKLNQYRRCCLNYALLKKKKREKNPLFIKIFRFLSGMNLTGVNGELTVWNALICLFCRNTGSILTILCLLCFNSTHYSGILSDLI